MDFFTISQTPYVFVKMFANEQFLNVHVEKLDRLTPLKTFHRDNNERTVMPVFKCQEDAMRFRRRTSECCYALNLWKTDEVYPIDHNMSHLSLTSKIKFSPNYPCELYDIAPFDLHDVDAILSLSLKAHIGFFMVGTFNILGNTISMNGIVVDLEHRCTDQEHIILLQNTYENIYLT